MNTLLKPLKAWKRTSYFQAIGQIHSELQRSILASIGNRCVRVCQLVWNGVPLSFLGLVLAVLACVAYFRWGVAVNDRILQNAIIAAGVIFAFCIVNVVIASSWLRFRPEPALSDQYCMRVGVPFRTNYRVRLLSWMPLLRIESSWITPAGCEIKVITPPSSHHECVEGQTRCEIANIVRAYRVRDLLGLCEIVILRRSLESASILPRPALCPPLQLWSTSNAEDPQSNNDGRPDGDLVDTRSYRPGDPLKWVLWKSYARTGQLLVRTPERATQRSQKTMAYFVAGEQDEATAAVAVDCIERGYLGTDFLFAADGTNRSVTTTKDAISEIVRSGNQHKENGAQITSFLQTGKSLGIETCVLFVPALDTGWLERVLIAVQSYQGACLVLVGVHDHRDAKYQNSSHSSSLYRRVLFSHDDVNQPDDRYTIQSKLEQVGARVTIICVPVDSA